MTSHAREQLRASFEQVAERYERVRPSYPEPLLDDLVGLAGLSPGARVLEIGCGTGQATLPLARRGLAITCVELGAELAAIARRKLAPFPAVEVVTSSIEQWRPPRAGFDAVCVFTAFHWLDPARRYELAASLLRPGGALAVVETGHVLPEDGDPFFADVQSDYAALCATDDHDKGPPPRPDEVGDLAGELEASGLFWPAEVRRHRLDVVYTAGEYLELLGTYSGHLALDRPLREALLERIRRRIEARPGAHVRKSYLFVLNVAARR